MIDNNLRKKEDEKEDCKKRVMSEWLIIAPSFYILLLLSAVLLNWDYVWSGKILNSPQVVPLVVWSGALGGVVASLQGIFRYNYHWDDSYDYWVIFSGIIGVAYAIFSYFILLMTQPGGHQILLGIAISAAFVAGFAQRQFTSLLHQLFDVIFQPHDDLNKNKGNENSK